ncbi:MAG TPA: DivIVA domain-containing protein [Mycobacteriales bacterium]|nr:DivIVA domain-containing protein [Mycobacteriales bacterium]
MSGLVQIPVEVAAQAPVFDVVARGYSKRQVRRHLAALEQELAELRWEHDDLAAQRRALAQQREDQARWTPSFDALGERVVQILRLAEQEAAVLRGEATREAERIGREATAGLTDRVAAAEQAAEQTRGRIDSELRALEVGVQTRRELLEAELGRIRRDAELEVAGRIAQAGARARDLLADAEREAAELRARARAEVVALQRRRDEIAAELLEVSARLVAVVHRFERTDVPLDLSAVHARAVQDGRSG